MDEALLDTDILSEVLKRKNRNVLDAAKRYLTLHGRLSFSEVTVYEIVRGMRAKGARSQLSAFLSTVNSCEVLPINRDVLLRAAELWAEAVRSGHARNDADLIIAATALEAGRVLVTANTAHFSWMPGLQVDDWRSMQP